VFIKLTRSGGRTYAQLPRQRTLATLGRIDDNGGQVDASCSRRLLRAKWPRCDR
jgi:hypothetical protein